MFVYLLVLRRKVKVQTGKAPRKSLLEMIGTMFVLVTVALLLGRRLQDWERPPPIEQEEAIGQASTIPAGTHDLADVDVVRGRSRVGAGARDDGADRPGGGRVVVCRTRPEAGARRAPLRARRRGRPGRRRVARRPPRRARSAPRRHRRVRAARARARGARPAAQARRGAARVSRPHARRAVRLRPGGPRAHGPVRKG